jgi:NAD(P)-dependent dehydrogenase (short-subunit alcohol dehydrogenase family)
MSGQRLADQVAIVTGAARGIGAFYAREMAREGARVVLADIVDGEELASEIRSQGGEAVFQRTDVSDAQSLDTMAHRAITEFGGIDVLVNNAAIFASLKFQPFTEIPDAEWDAVMRVNVGGIFRAARAVVPSMRLRGRGKIVNISSGTAFIGSPMLLHYVTSKAAVLGFTRALARELGASSICVNAIAPGFTESDSVLGNPAYGQSVRDRVQGARALARAQLPDDLVGALIFLASRESDFVTGQTLVVDGGHHMH